MTEYATMKQAHDIDIAADGNELYCERDGKTDIRVLNRRGGTVTFWTVRPDGENIRTMLPIELIEAIAAEWGEEPTLD